MFKNKKTILAGLILMGMSLVNISYADYTYETKAGDSLYKIGKKFNVSVEELKKANGLYNNYLSINQELIIPSEYEYHQIKSSDTLWKLANKLDTTVSNLINLNNGINPNNLIDGTWIKVPKSKNSIWYTVKKGDTLWKISQKYNTTISKIKADNNLKSDYLSVGTKLKIVKGGNSSNKSSESTYNGGSSNNKTTTYTVKRGDTLWNIAMSHGVQVSEIKKINNLKSDYLSDGQKLIIPEEKVYPTNSTVKSKMNAFPFKKGTYNQFVRDYGVPRSWSPSGEVSRRHEGQDIIADKWTPVYAVASGKIISYGWSEYGGYRLMIDVDGINYATYYAHFSSYAKGLYNGKKVKAGDLIGYVGSTGYGPEGTSGKFINHLHFGIYDLSTGGTIDPYPYLKDLEKKL